MNLRTNGEDSVTPIPREGFYRSKGLTKRERFAVEIMKAMLSSQPESKYMHIPDFAVTLADKLIEALNKEG